MAVIGVGSRIFEPVAGRMIVEQGVGDEVTGLRIRTHYLPGDSTGGRYSRFVELGVESGGRCQAYRWNSVEMASVEPIMSGFVPPSWVNPP